VPRVRGEGRARGVSSPSVVSGADCSARAPLEVAPRFSDSTRGRVGGPGDESS